MGNYLGKIKSNIFCKIPALLRKLSNNNVEYKWTSEYSDAVEK